VAGARRCGREPQERERPLKRRWLLSIVIVTALFVALLAGCWPADGARRSTNLEAVTWLRGKIEKQKHETWKCQNALGSQRTKGALTYRWSEDIEYLQFIRHRWEGRHVACDKLASRRLAVVQRLAHGLQGTALRGLEHEFEQAAWAENMNPYFLVGASGTESSFGAAPCTRDNNPKNIWGLGACGTRWQEPIFGTWREAITYYVWFIRDRWPHAQTCYQLSGYCPECGTYGWGLATHQKMRQLFGSVSASLAYPR